MIPLFAIALREMADLMILFLASFGLFNPIILIIWISFRVIGSSLQGYLSDLYCRKKSLVFSTSVTGVVVWLLWLYPASAIFILIVDGLLGNMTPIARAAFLDNDKEESKRRSIAWTFLAQAFPWALLCLAPYIQVPNQIFWELGVLVSTGVVLFLVAGFFSDKRDREAHHIKFKFSNFMKQKGFFLYLVAFFLAEVAYQVTTFFVEHSFSTIFKFEIFGLFGLGMFVGVLVHFFAKKDLFVSSSMISSIFGLGFLLFFLKFISYSWAMDAKFDFTLLTYTAAIGGIYLPLIYGYYTQKRSPHEQGKICGLLESVQTLAELAGPIFAAMLLSFQMYWILLGVGGVFFVSWLLTHPWRKGKRAKHLEDSQIKT